MAYADGELEGDARARVEELVKTSDEARRVLDAMGVLGDVVRDGVSARADSAAVDAIADEVIAQIERNAPTMRGSRIVVPITQARPSGRRGGVAIVVTVLALAAGAVLLLRSGSPTPVADGTPHETPPVVQPPAPAPTETASAMPSEVAAADEQGVDLEEVSSTKNKVNVFFMPTPASAGAVASVVVWIDDRGGKK
jgi:anti-sigma factor RsiW